MKRLIAIGAALVTLIGLMSCGSTDNNAGSNNKTSAGSAENKTELTTVNTVADSQNIIKSELNNTQSDHNKIKISTPDGDIVIALEDNSATKDLLGRLPMTLEFEDFNSTEKISQIEGNKLDTSTSVNNYAPKAGSFAYYIPWGNLSLFYNDFRESDGLASLGIVESGMEYVNKLDTYGNVTIDVVDTKSDNAGAVTNPTSAMAAKDNTSKTLVAYFSCTGNTKSIAEAIASGTNADIYEIKAETPYTSADLNYNDNNSRSTKEMNDKSSRPAIAGSDINMASYETIYIGYPIWWGEAPRILDTFVEKYDFTGKTVIPFCTSASSGIGSSDKNLAGLAKSGTWKSGHRFSGRESASEVMSWVNSQ